MTQQPMAGRPGRRRGKLGVAALSALALTVVGGVGAGASTDTTEPAGTEPAGSDAVRFGGRGRRLRHRREQHPRRQRLA